MVVYPDIGSVRTGRSVYRKEKSVMELSIVMTAQMKRIVVRMHAQTSTNERTHIRTHLEKLLIWTSVNIFNLFFQVEKNVVG